MFTPPTCIMLYNGNFDKVVDKLDLSKTTEAAHSHIVQNDI